MSKPEFGPLSDALLRRQLTDAGALWGVPDDKTKNTVAKFLEKKPESRNYAVIIVHHHRFDETKDLLQSVHEWDEPPGRVLVADNSAPHYDWSFTKELTPPVSVYSFEENLGYGAAVNRLVDDLPVEMSQFLVLTHEVRLEPDCSRLLLDTLRTPGKVAVSAPMLVYKDRPDTVFSRGGTLSKRGTAKHLGMGDKVEESVRVKRAEWSVDWADGACLMIRKDVFETLNGFDPRYFLYVEEIDFQLRARLSSASIVVTPQAVAAQMPGRYPLFLKYRNHRFLSRKMRPYLRSWPWAIQLIRDTARWLAGRISDSPLAALRGFFALR